MKAILMAGGMGARLRPYTITIPKPLVPVGDRPILEIILAQMRAAGVTDVVICLGHMADLIRSYIQSCGASLAPLRVSCVQESEPLGTVGALRLVPQLESTTLVMNCDVLTTLSFSALLAHHVASGAALTIATHEKEVRVEFGVLECTPSAQVVKYLEKPILHYRVSMGVYLVEPRVLKYIPPNRPYGFNELVLTMIGAGEVVSAYASPDIWIDIGHPDAYGEGVAAYEAHRALFGVPTANDGRPGPTPSRD